MANGVKIEIKAPKAIRFGKLGEGSFFVAPSRSNETVYMKMTWCWSDPNDSGIVRNAVNTSTGASASFDDSDEVLKLKGEMKFEYE